MVEKGYQLQVYKALGGKRKALEKKKERKKRKTKSGAESQKLICLK